MPRIDPIQLLNCLSVLLSPTGGIKSRDEVHRLANLMTKFSKKLVSKCIYIQILKCTETDLLGLFMGSGGWRLVHLWLTENIIYKNWPLVRELLELLLLCPVDVERLKTNNCPKLVKELSKDGNHLAIRALASKLVEQWLKAVKGEQVTPIIITDISQIISDFQCEIKSENLKSDVAPDNEVVKSNDEENSSTNENHSINVKVENKENNSETNHDETLEKEENENDTLPVLKITLKNGKQILSQVEEDKEPEDESEKEKSRDKHKSKSRDKTNDKNSSNSNSSKSSSTSKHSSKSSSEKSRSSSSSSSHKDSKHSSKDKSKDRHSSHSSKSKSSSTSSSGNSRKSSSSSSSKSKESKNEQKHGSDKDKSRERDKDLKSSSEKSDDKTQTPSIQKLGKIPKLSDVKKEKPSISIEIRKPDEPKPKTVKTFNSKFRKHGLEEEIKPPPSRASVLSNKKPPPVLPPTISIPKRPSPVHNETPPEKKPKTVVEIEKPGAIKLIPPKPKRNGGCKYMLKITLACLQNYINFYLKRGKSKMHNLTGSIIFVQELTVKYLYQIKVKFYNKKIFR
ncbi:unnamed protein product [Euphydryas editha]|uniref:TFIIS N-terminal domain-containing protein n=1 Tax=Euphydryas editha TaxID=104508 RepID=A0AAU9V3L5_EUPED|nr:unnamed protein product [Euphydryas editha]